MEIKNSTRKNIIAKDAKTCSKIFSKTFGLMFSKPRTLIFIFKKEKIVPLHMFFVFYPLDILFLNEKKVVVEKKENLRPFRTYSPKKKAMYILEMTKGIIKKSKTRIGDKIIF